MTEDEVVGWHHQFYGHEFEQAPGDGEGQGSLACCNLCTIILIPKPDKDATEKKTTGQYH